MPSGATSPRQHWLGVLLLSIVLYLPLQTAVVLTHEYAHSTAAWLLGKSPTPRTVVWGNPTTITGWDEGVPYDRLFPQGHSRAEAVIGGVPLLLHALATLLASALLLRPGLPAHRVRFLALFWFLVINLTELIAYLAMRPFAGSGDTGRFNQGLALSPWPLFITGAAFLLLALWVFRTRVTSRLDAALHGNRAAHRAVIWLAAFLLFLGGSGLRILALFPDRQWRWGLIGPVAFLAWILADQPGPPGDFAPQTAPPRL